MAPRQTNPLRVAGNAPTVLSCLALMRSRQGMNRAKTEKCDRLCHPASSRLLIPAPVVAPVGWTVVPAAQLLLC